MKNESATAIRARTVLNLVKFGHMAHGQNNNSSHRPTKLTLENTLVLFTAK